MIIRHLRPSDITNTAILMNYYRDDQNINDEEWDIEKVVQNLKQYAIGADHCCLLAMEGDRVVGGIMGCVKQEFYNNKAAAIMHFVFLLPTHRTDDNYFQLFDKYKEWASRYGAEKYVLTDIMDNSTRLIEIGEILGFDLEKVNLYIKDAV